MSPATDPPRFFLKFSVTLADITQVTGRVDPHRSCHIVTGAVWREYFFPVESTGRLVQAAEHRAAARRQDRAQAGTIHLGRAVSRPGAAEPAERPQPGPGGRHPAGHGPAQGSAPRRHGTPGLSDLRAAPHVSAGADPRRSAGASQRHGPTGQCPGALRPGGRGRARPGVDGGWTGLERRAGQSCHGQPGPARRPDPDCARRSGASRRPPHRRQCGPAQSAARFAAAHLGDDQRQRQPGHGPWSARRSTARAPAWPAMPR